MRWLRAFGRFWYDFLIGDDPKIAIGVVVAVGLLAAAMWSGALGDRALAVLGGVLIIAMFAGGLALDTRRRR